MRVNVWIRKECQDAWNQIDNKSEWISDMLLNGLSSNGKTRAFEASSLGSSPGEPAIDAKWKSAGEAAKALMTPDCCLVEETNCEHFKWNMESGEFINEKTGDRRSE